MSELYWQNTNLYYATNNDDILIYGSESFIINEVIEKSGLAKKGFKVQHLKSNTGIFINLSNFEFLNFNINE